MDGISLTVLIPKSYPRRPIWVYSPDQFLVSYREVTLLNVLGKGGLGSTKFVAFEKLAWHNECFFCALCKVSMVGKGFIQGRRRIYRTGQINKFTKIFLHLLTSSLSILVILLQSVSCSWNLQAGFTSADVEALDLQSLGVLMLEHLRNLFYIVSQVCTA